MGSGETRQNVRTLHQVWDDLLWPSTGASDLDPEQSIRHQAVAEVLCSLPEHDYDKLKAAIERFQWFIPNSEWLGGCQPFGITHNEDLGSSTRMQYAAVLWLSPILERVAWDIVVAVVAHELAHIVLNHRLFAASVYEIQEEEAWNLVKTWGFGREAKKHEARSKWKGAYEKYLIKKLQQGNKDGQGLKKRPCGHD